MSDEIVKYSNQFNNQALRKFTALDLDLLMAIASRVRDKGTDEVAFTFEELKRLTGQNRLILVNPAYTSQTCSECGYCDSRNRESQADFECKQCHMSMNADLNAANNILKRGVTCSLHLTS